MRSPWYISDTHFWHHNVIRKCRRPFTTVADMNECIIDEINSKVGIKDTLYHLGDLAYGIPNRLYEEYVDKIMGQIRCKNVHLIYGNHDRLLRRKKSLHRHFKSLSDLCEIRHNGQKIVLCHYAMAVWRHNYRGTWHLFGHSHGSFEPWRERHMPNAKMQEVGVDLRYRMGRGFGPWPHEEIAEIMATRGGENVDGHGCDDENDEV